MLLHVTVATLVWENVRSKPHVAVWDTPGSVGLPQWWNPCTPHVHLQCKQQKQASSTVPRGWWPSGGSDAGTLRQYTHRYTLQIQSSPTEPLWCDFCFLLKPCSIWKHCNRIDAQMYLTYCEHNCSHCLSATPSSAIWACISYGISCGVFLDENPLIWAVCSISTAFSAHVLWKTGKNKMCPLSLNHYVMFVIPVCVHSVQTVVAHTCNPLHWPLTVMVPIPIILLFILPDPISPPRTVSHGDPRAGQWAQFSLCSVQTGCGSNVCSATHTLRTRVPALWAQIILLNWEAAGPLFAH